MYHDGWPILCGKYFAIDVSIIFLNRWNWCVLPVLFEKTRLKGFLSDICKLLKYVWPILSIKHQNNIHTHHIIVWLTRLRTEIISNICTRYLAKTPSDRVLHFTWGKPPFLTYPSTSIWLRTTHKKYFDVIICGNDLYRLAPFNALLEIDAVKT